MPLQGLKRRIPACSLGDPSGSVIRGHPRRGQGHPVLPCRGGTLGTAWALLSSPAGWEGEHRNFWKLRGGGISLLPNSPFEQIFISVFPRTSSAEPLSEQRSCSGWDCDGIGLQEAGSAWIVPSSASLPGSSSISRMLNLSPNVKLQKMLICLRS